MILVSIAVVGSASLCILVTMLSYCPHAGLERDVSETPAPPVPAPTLSPSLHVVMQSPALPRDSPRHPEYHYALLATLMHPQVALVHVLSESVAHQGVLYEEVPPELHHKLRTFNIAKRMSYADAVRYANLYLINATTVICNADVAINGLHWDLLNATTLAGHLYGLTRHESAGCAGECDCIHKWGGCYDAFVFTPPLLGGDALLERISFRMGGLWGSENRFMWEVHLSNPQLRISNPCRTFRLLHYHCMGQGRFRPTQDHRRINDGGRSLEPFPTRWHPRE